MNKKGLEYQLFALLSLIFLYKNPATEPHRSPRSKSIELPQSLPDKKRQNPSPQDQKTEQKNTQKSPSKTKTPLPDQKTQKPSSQQNQDQKSTEESQKKDEVLEELQLINQGVSLEAISFEETKKSESEKELLEKTPQTEDSLEESSPEKPSQNESKKAQNSPQYPPTIDELKKMQDELFSYFPTKQKLDKILKEYVALLELQPDSKSPEAKIIYWELFQLMHKYTQWTKGTSLYNTSITEDVMSLLHDIQEIFNDTQKTSPYLCEYLLLNGFYTEGLQQCEKAIQLNPKNPRPYIIQFQYSQRKNERDLLKILKKFPKSPEVLTTVSQYFKDKKNYRLSQKYITKALDFNPNFEKALFEMADILFLKKEYQQALTYYIKICEKYHMKAKKPFRSAKSKLSQQNLFNLANEYQNALNICISNTPLSPNHSNLTKKNYQLLLGASDKF